VQDMKEGDEVGREGGGREGGGELDKVVHAALKAWREYRGDVTTLSYLDRSMSNLERVELWDRCG
jgi:hypothetical protein